eukprot:c13730_g1_i1.p1 GENE.c13730_g1_i1~~c13730_g1_i1.p1  ORF type:complete len:185 (+),score=83.46 c13730_g1_i1:21-575(+)
MSKTFGEGSIVCKNAQVSGSVSIGKNNIVHPLASLVSAGGTLVFDEGNLVEEFVKISNNGSMKIGKYNAFRVGCVIESSAIGDGNIFQIRSKVGAGCKIGSGCVIGIGVEIPPGTEVPDHTIFYQDYLHQRVIPSVLDRNLKLCKDEIDLIKSQKLLESHGTLGAAPAAGASGGGATATAAAAP